MKPEDITQSIACAPDVIHISLPVSDLMLQRILKKDRQWAKKQIQLCALMALDRGFEVSVGFQDASRAEVKFMLEMATFLEKIGVQSIKLSDTIGLLTPSDTQSLVTQMVHEVAIDVGIHTHNDFGMAVANAISAVQAGAKTVDVTLYGIGERAGNCDAFTLLDAVEGIFETAPQRDAMKGIQLKADSLLFAAGGIRKWIDLSGRAL
jgi:homocitrate synthase NifV